MSAILPNEGQLDQIAKLLAAEGANLRVGLYTARGVYSKATVLSDITAATFSGYAAQTPAFSSGGLDGAGRNTYAASTMTFTHNGGGTSNTVLGYYLWNNSSGKVYFLEDFGAPIFLGSNGAHVTATPTWYYGDLTPPL